MVAERNINLSPPSTDATTTDVLVVPSSSSAPPPEVVVRPRARFAGKSNEEAAAILIQTVFRGYLVSSLVPGSFSCLFYCSVSLWCINFCLCVIQGKKSNTGNEGFGEA